MLWICKRDGVKYPPGLPCCPQPGCGSTDYEEEGARVAAPEPVTGEGSPADEAATDTTAAPHAGLAALLDGP